MAERSLTLIPLPAGAANRDCISAKWTGLLNGDTGQRFECGAYSDRSIEVKGTLGVGGTVTVQFSNIEDPSTADADWSTLTDPQGNDLAITALKGEALSEIGRWLRVKTAGDGTTNLSVYFYGRTK